jgi:hypothetical protein
MRRQSCWAPSSDGDRRIGQPYNAPSTNIVAGEAALRPEWNLRALGRAQGQWGLRTRRDRVRPHHPEGRDQPDCGIATCCPAPRCTSGAGLSVRPLQPACRTAGRQCLAGSLEALQKRPEVTRERDGATANDASRNPKCPARTLVGKAVSTHRSRRSRTRTSARRACSTTPTIPACRGPRRWHRHRCICPRRRATSLIAHRCSASTRTRSSQSSATRKAAIDALRAANFI